MRLEKVLVHFVDELVGSVGSVRLGLSLFERLGKDVSLGKGRG